jgi:hypothetical protein
MPQKTLEELTSLVELQQKQIEKLQKENALLKQELAEVRAELRKFNNENTPTSAIPHYEKENTNQRHKHSGQKEGHKGMSRKKPENIDRIKHLTMEVSPCCNKPVRKMRAKPKERTVTHLLPPKLENVKYLKDRCICTGCEKEVQPEVPNTIPNARFDLSFMVLISVLSVGMNLPFGKIKELLKFLWRLDVSEATISNTLTRLSDFLGEDYEKLKQEIKGATARYNDETGWRILGKGSWLWIFISEKVALYHIQNSRGKKVVRKILGKKPDGVDVTDGLPSYTELQSRKQKCWAHILRRFRQITFPFKNRTEKKHFRKLRNSLKLIFKRAKDEKEKLGISVNLKEKYDKKLDRIISKHYKGKNLEKILVTLRNQKQELFTFLEFVDVDPTNNRAEQALKAPIIKRKISYQNRSIKHAQNYAMQLSLMKTAELRGQKYPEVLQNIIQNQLSAGKF